MRKLFSILTVVCILLTFCGFIQIGIDCYSMSKGGEPNILNAYKSFDHHLGVVFYLLFPIFSWSFAVMSYFIRRVYYR